VIRRSSVNSGYFERTRQVLAEYCRRQAVLRVVGELDRPFGRLHASDQTCGPNDSSRNNCISGVTRSTTIPFITVPSLPPAVRTVAPFATASDTNRCTRSTVGSTVKTLHRSHDQCLDVVA
jgi:hypothetical protein